MSSLARPEFVLLGIGGTVALLTASPVVLETVSLEFLYGVSVSAVFLSILSYFLGAEPRLLDGKDTNAFVKVELTEKENVTHDVRRLRFKLPSERHVLGLPLGKHIVLRADINGESVARQYTPVTMVDDQGFFDLCLKIYFKDVHPKFPDGGKMSQYLNNMTIGSTIDVRGPTGTHTYHGHGVFTKEHPRTKEVKEKRKATHVGMIAGGTGITPMLQIIRHVLRDPTEKTQLSLLFANQTEDDILLRTELEECAKDPRFNVWYTVDRPSEGWKYSSGFINEEMIKEHLPPSGPDSQIVMCGPPPMIKFACLPNLEKVGYTEKNWIVM